MTEILVSLERFEFPLCAIKGLEQLEKCFASSNSSIPGLHAGEEISEKIVTFFIFSAGRTGKGKELTAIQQLQLQELLITYYEGQENVQLGHSVFKALFGAGITEQRADILCRLLSMAVPLRSSKVLAAAATWMQMQGYSSDLVCKLAQRLVDDYCQLVPGAISALKELPVLSPQFTCNFITALTTTYHPPGSKAGKRIIPHLVLEMLTEWVLQDPGLCLVSLSHGHTDSSQPHSQHITLWTSPSKTNTQTPVPGLVRWCTKAPICHALDEKSSPNSSDNHHLWSQMHLGLLQTISELPKVPGAAQLELITLSDMNRIVKDVTGLVKLVPGGVESEAVQLSVERLVQILQVALATGGFRCSLSDLGNICKQIPPNRLLGILERMHLSSGPPPMHNVS